MDYKRFENESDEALIFRVSKDREIYGYTWQDVANILNPLLGTDYGESTFRKKYTAFKQMFEANRDLFVNDSRALEKLREEERRLEIEKIKFRDERNAWSNQNRIQARAEAKFDNIEDSLLDFGRIYFPQHPSAHVDGSRTMLIMLSDLHIGATFDNYWGKYNSDIAKHRLDQLLAEVRNIAVRHHCDNCVVALLGDQISGKIHRTIQVTNRENVIEQIKRAAELISSFCYELTGSFNDVNMISVAGNHSRLDKKDESLTDERADDLIAWIVSKTLSHIPNFHFLEDANIDNTVALFDIEGKWYFAVHGDYDEFSKTGLQNLITMIHAIPYCCLFGHKHYCAINSVNNILMVQGGSLSGSGDDFTVQKRLSGKASQMVCICSDNGIEAFYPIELE